MVAYTNALNLQGRLSDIAGKNAARHSRMLGAGIAGQQAVTLRYQESPAFVPSPTSITRHF